MPGSNNENNGISGPELDAREEKLLKRKEKLDALEANIRVREKELAAKESKRKQIVLRLPESLWNEIARWAEDDFRSINGQIEYLLTKSVRERK
ncbi:MAG: hypothetical protein IKG17_05365 [Mogibacterium sp.]|nr:hypothetical protein [Mogibacterium sp.]